MSPTRTSTTIDQADQDQGQDSPSQTLQAPIPGFRPPRSILPGSTNPDPPLPAEDVGDHQAGDRAPNEQPASIQAFFKQRAKSYAKIAETLLMAAGGLINARAGTDSEAFLPDDDDTETIPPPVGRLMARRIKIGADPEQLTDIEDIGIAAVGLVMWAAKGLTLLWEERRERRRIEAGRAVHSETGDGQ